MSQLNYTLNSIESVDEYDEKIYGAEAPNVYALISSGNATEEDVLWYQSFEGFWFLSGLPYRTERLAAEIRRYVFRKLLHGEEIIRGDKSIFKTSDGKIYSSLTDEKLLDQMAEALQNCYRKAEIYKDRTAYQVPLNPQRFKKILLQGKIERRPLIRLAFALGLAWQDFRRFLDNAAFIRRLSPAVPEELIVIYCLQRRLKWNDVARLQKAADEISKSIAPSTEKNSSPVITHDPDGLENMDEKIFVGTVLKKCCEEAAAKLDNDRRQFSLTAWNLIVKHSILNEKYAGLTLPPGHNTIWLSDTLLRYADKFSLDRYDFPTIAKSRILSRDMYCRFLAYRITMPNPPKGHATKIFSMRQGTLPKEIADNIFKYSEVVNLSKKRHLIDRYDLLLTIFYEFLMEIWRDGRTPFVAPNQKAANKLWRQFLNRANVILPSAGYSMMSIKNPLDVLLRIALRSICPLETYARIYELNVIAALSKEKLDAKKYPSADRVRNALDGLSASYKKLSEAGIINDEQLKAVREFESKARKVL